jgi:iron complex transport system ATP-binding protein
MSAATANHASRDGGAAIFELDGVSYAVPGRQILAPLSLALPPGRICGLIGSNGSGKSTLMRLLARQLAPASGSLRFRGRVYREWSEREFARNVAYMPQFTPRSDGMNVRELVALGRYPWHGMLGRFTREDAGKVEDAIRRTGLEPLAYRIVDSLSGGERQRAWLALMLAQDTSCLLLDEPTSALDVAHETGMLDLVRELSRERGTAVVVVLHDINLAARICDDIVALRDGRVIAHAGAHDLMRPETLAAIYGVPMGIIAHPTRGEPLSYVL